MDTTSLVVDATTAAPVIGISRPTLPLRFLAIAGLRRKRITAAGLAERCRVEAGDFFQAVPPAGDAYLLKWIIHDWDEAQSVTILQNCHRAMAKDGRLLLVEAVIPRGNAPFFHKFIDLTLLVAVGGHERTEAEYHDLLEAAGFRLTSITPTQSEMSVIEAVPA